MTEPAPQLPDDPRRDFTPGWRGALKRLGAELGGTFAMTIVDAGGTMIAATSADVSPAARSAASGLLAMSMAFALSNVSGAHFNPAVTLAFALRRAFPWRFVPEYCLAQLAGALLGAAALRALLGHVAHVGATMPERGDGLAFVTEALLTAMVVAVTLSVATRHKVLGSNAALATGGVLALCKLFARPLSGASMNPARSWGSFLVDGSLAHAWVYLVGPVLGAIAAVLYVAVVHPHRHREETEAACGDP